MNIASLLQGVASVAWVAAIAALGFVVFNVTRGRKFAGGAVLVIGAVVVALALTSVAAGLVFIEPEQRGVVVTISQGGLRPEPLDPGLHWIVPFVERVERYGISRQNYTMSSAQTEGQVLGDDSIRARTNDGQEVFIDASVIFSIDPAKVVNLHIIWQERYANDLVRPLARGIVRDVASQYGVEEIVSTKRAEMELLVTETLTAKMAENDLLLQDFVLRDIHFSEEYAAAVEQKQIAEQQAQQAAFVVQQREQEAQQARVTAQGQADAAVIAAQGRAQATVLQAEAEAEARVVQARAEAEALALISASLKDNPDLLTYRYIERLAPNVQVMYLPANSPYLIPLPTATESTSVIVTPEPTPSTP